MSTWLGCQPCLREGDCHVEEVQGGVALEPPFGHPRREGQGPALGLEQAEQAAPAFVPHQAAQVLVRLGQVPPALAGQLEGDHQVVCLPHGRY